MKVFIFPGQGSQRKGMGAELFDAFPYYEHLADTILGYSIRTLCLKDPNQELNKTQFTQPALYVVNALTYLKKVQDGEKKPDQLAGHSLGEFNALFAAGVFDFETGLKLVKKRGELMGHANGGAMAAVIGCNTDQVIHLLKQHNLIEIDIANYNSPDQVVLSGTTSEIFKAGIIFEQADAIYVPLNVSAAFHSRYMEQIKEEFAQYLDNFNFQKPEIPVISNVTARPYTANSIKSNLISQLSSPVRWTESMRYLFDIGCDAFEELGPGNVLTKLHKTIAKSILREEK